MRITINLATRPFANLGPILKRLRIAMAVFAGLSILLGVGLYLMHHKAEQARARNHSLDGDIARITHERQGYEAMMRQPENAQVLNEASTLNQLFDEKTFSWTLAMEDLETVLPGGVQVTTLEPIRDKEGRITLRLRVVGPRDKAVELVQNLEHSKFFIRPTIVGESSENAGGPGQVLEPVSASNKVNFDLLAEFNAAALAKEPPVLKAAEKSEEARKSGAAAHPASAGVPGPGLRRPPTAGAARQSPSALRQSGAQHPTVPQAQPPSRPHPMPNPGAPQ